MISIPHTYFIVSQPESNATLKNGAQVSSELLRTTMISLRELQRDTYSAFFDLVMRCKDDQHIMSNAAYGDSEAILRQCGLMGNNGISEEVKNIVLCSVRGDPLEMIVQPPV